MLKSHRGNEPLAWPAVWQSLVRMHCWVVLALTVMTVVFLLIASTADDIGSAVLAALGVLIYAFGAAFTFATSIRARRRTRSQIVLCESLTCLSGTFIKNSKAVELVYLSFSVAIGSLLFLLPLVVETMSLTDDWNSLRLRSVAQYSPVLALYPVLLLLSPVVRKRRQLGLRLAPDGVYYYTWFGSCFFAWDWIREIRPHGGKGLAVDLVVREPIQRPVNPEENWLGRTGFFRRRRTRIEVGYLAVNPAVAFYALRFYHRHPELRSELGTEAGLERLRSGDLES